MQMLKEYLVLNICWCMSISNYSRLEIIDVKLFRKINVGICHHKARKLYIFFGH